MWEENKIEILFSEREDNCRERESLLIERKGMNVAEMKSYWAQEEVARKKVARH